MSLSPEGLSHHKGRTWEYQTLLVSPLIEMWLKISGGKNSDNLLSGRGLAIVPYVRNHKVTQWGQFLLSLLFLELELHYLVTSKSMYTAYSFSE